MNLCFRLKRFHDTGILSKESLSSLSLSKSLNHDLINNDLGLEGLY